MESDRPFVLQEAKQNPNLREQDQLSLGPEALKQRKSVYDFIDGYTPALNKNLQVAILSPSSLCGDSY